MNNIAVKALLILLVLAVPAGQKGVSAESDIENKVKAVFIEKFTRFIDWPDAERDSRKNFIIGITGPTTVSRYLQEITKKRTIKNMPVLIMDLNESSRLTECHVIFIAASSRLSVGRVLAVTSNRPILTIGESKGLADRGVLINFFQAESTTRFEINMPAVKKSRLRFSSRLLRIGKIIGGEDPQ